eukprot:6696662-Heterocapsa_arctica.AAC.1
MDIRCRSSTSWRSVRTRPPIVSANRSAPPRLAEDLLGDSSSTVRGSPSARLPRAAAIARNTD